MLQPETPDRSKERARGATTFRLCASLVEVEVGLRKVGDRWIAIAEIDGERAVGLSSSPRGALKAAVSRLGPSTTAALLADPQLFEVSLRLR